MNTKPWINKITVINQQMLIIKAFTFVNQKMNKEEILIWHPIFININMHQTVNNKPIYLKTNTNLKDKQLRSGVEFHRK